MRFKLELNVNDSHGRIGNVGDLCDHVIGAMKGLAHRYGTGGALETRIDRSLVDPQSGAVTGRCAVVDGAAWQPEQASRPYGYEDACKVLREILVDLETISGERMASGPHAKHSWHDVAGTAAVNLRVLAGMLDGARTGRTKDGPVVFPSVVEELENSRND